ncbi:EcsC family protein [Frigidibacter oleivorans]|uniref:EcsC family protein n=1 Tax=Frigidibacter oleivorans TaxID=2487129 RepID=UPI000F8D1343|nr:EcsC family protein [Frigidibacter oleivorans]
MTAPENAETPTDTLAAARPLAERLADPALAVALDALAARHQAANGLAMQAMGMVGGSAENLLERLPDKVKDRLETVTRAALETSFALAARSRGVLGDRSDRVNTALATAMGVAGGAGGLATAMAELPVTTTMLLRAIQGIAADHGFDPQDEQTRIDCIRVFASAGPMTKDDGSDLGFLAARVTLTGTSVNALIARVAPRLSVVLGQKLATQMVPVLGAVAGAAVNYSYTSYYQEMARVQFGLRKLAEAQGLPREALTEALRARIRARAAGRSEVGRAAGG